MSNKPSTLFCFIDGEKTAFSVKIASSNNVGDLKKRIKAQQSPAFDHIVANKLTLWKVPIPAAPKKERKEISLADVLSKEELDETDDISDVFPKTPPKKIIHTIVLRPSLLLSGTETWLIDPAT